MFCNLEIYRRPVQPTGQLHVKYGAVLRTEQADPLKHGFESQAELYPQVGPVNGKTQQQLKHFKRIKIQISLTSNRKGIPYIIKISTQSIRKNL